jgi:hypothetical protein
MKFEAVIFVGVASFAAGYVVTRYPEKHEVADDFAGMIWLGNTVTDPGMTYVFHQSGRNAICVTETPTISEDQP